MDPETLRLIVSLLVAVLYAIFGIIVIMVPFYIFAIHSRLQECSHYLASIDRKMRAGGQSVPRPKEPFESAFLDEK